jgi:hypothetical protein
VLEQYKLPMSVGQIGNSTDISWKFIFLTELLAIAFLTLHQGCHELRPKNTIRRELIFWWCCSSGFLRRVDPAPKPRRTSSSSTQ